MRYAIMFVLIAMLAGCAAIEESPATSQLTVQYATLKVIEQSDDVSQADVVEHVQRARDVLDSSEEVSIDQLMSSVDLSGLDPSDRLLISTLLAQIEYAAEDIDVVGEERRVRLMTLLDWIEQAASYANQDS